METSEIKHIKGVIEALLFVSEKPVTLDQFKEVLEIVSAFDIKETLELLKKEYEDRDAGMIIMEIAEGYQMLSSPHHALSIRAFYKTKHKERLSKPALETLAIIAYKQPVSRMDVELIRGVNSDGVFSHLLTKGLIKLTGRKDVPGRPFIYGTSKQFLEYFGLKSLNDLPKLEDFALLEPIASKEEQQELVLHAKSDSSDLPTGKSEALEQEVVAQENVSADEQNDSSENQAQESTTIQEKIASFMEEAKEMTAATIESELSEEEISIKREENVLETEDISENQKKA